MRISTAWNYQRAISMLLQQRSKLAHTQEQLSTDKRILEPADDPLGATQALGLDRALARTRQYQDNIGAASDRLDREEQALASAGDVLGKVRQLALEANNASQTNTTRSDIAVEVRQRIDQLRQIANTRDGRGEYIFSGYSTRTQPFAKGADGVTYQGDNGQRLFQIGENQQIAAGDNGAEVFVRIPDGNGTFSVTPGAINAGSGVVGESSITDPAVYNGATYTVKFTASDAYEVQDSTGTVVKNGAFTDGDSIDFEGIQFTLMGTPAAGDTFVAAPSANRSIFKTLGNLADAIETPTSDGASSARLHNAVNAALNGIDQGAGNLLHVRGRIGARLNNLDGQKSLNSDDSLELKSRLSKIQDVDYAAAARRLTQQSTVLQAAQQAFIKVQGLSLFNFLR
jgi:flagellar hook-associated protein 3 FlgL